MCFIFCCLSRFLLSYLCQLTILRVDQWKQNLAVVYRWLIQLTSHSRNSAGPLLDAFRFEISFNYKAIMSSVKKLHIPFSENISTWRTVYSNYSQTLFSCHLLYGCGLNIASRALLINLMFIIALPPQHLRNDKYVNLHNYEMNVRFKNEMTFSY